MILVCNAMWPKLGLSDMRLGTPTDSSRQRKGVGGGEVEEEREIKGENYDREKEAIFSLHHHCRHHRHHRPTQRRRGAVSGKQRSY